MEEFTIQRDSKPTRVSTYTGAVCDNRRGCIEMHQGEWSVEKQIETIVTLP